MAPTAMLLSEEERLAADVLIKKSAVEKAAFEGDGTRAWGLSWNNHKDYKKLIFHDKYNWDENSVSSYPDFIYPSKYGQPTYFSHEAPLPVGAKGGMVYVDGEDSTARKWLVAYDCVNMKVYVEAGPTGPTDWNVIEVKLNSSGSVSEYEDPIMHGKARAEIMPYTGTVATLVYARFNY